MVRLLGPAGVALGLALTGHFFLFQACTAAFCRLLLQGSATLRLLCLRPLLLLRMGAWIAGRCGR